MKKWLGDSMVTPHPPYKAIKRVQNDCSLIVNDIFQTDFDEVCYQGPNR